MTPLKPLATPRGKISLKPLARAWVPTRYYLWAYIPIWKENGGERNITPVTDLVQLSQIHMHDPSAAQAGFSLLIQNILYNKIYIYLIYVCLFLIIKKSKMIS